MPHPRRPGHEPGRALGRGVHGGPGGAPGTPGSTGTAHDFLLCTVGASWAVVPEVFGWLAPDLPDLYAAHPERSRLRALRAEHGLRCPAELWVCTTDGARAMESIAMLRRWWQRLGELQVDVMTPHESHYYQQRDEARSGGIKSPHDSGQPNPIHFITVPPDSKFVFHLQCGLPHLQRIAPVLAERAPWQELLRAAFEHAFAWLGFGAKRAMGYGAMAEDLGARQQREAARAQAVADAAAEARRKAIEAMTPEDSAWELAQPVVEAFRAELAKGKAAGACNPDGPFNQGRQAFLKTALAWTEARSRPAAGEVLADSATKAWGRPSKIKIRWAELQAAIGQLEGEA